MPDGNNSLYLLQFFDPTGIGALQTDLKTFRTEVRRGQPFDDAGGDGIVSRRDSQTRQGRILVNAQFSIVGTPRD
jgi:hypothetical protein